MDKERLMLAKRWLDGVVKCLSGFELETGLTEDAMIPELEAALTPGESPLVDIREIAHHTARLYDWVHRQLKEKGAMPAKQWQCPNCGIELDENNCCKYCQLRVIKSTVPSP